MKIKISLSSAELQKLKLVLIKVFTEAHINCDRATDKTLIVHKDHKTVANLLKAAGWVYEEQYEEWSTGGSDYVLVLKGGGSATSVEFVYNG